MFSQDEESDLPEETTTVHTARLWRVEMANASSEFVFAETQEQAESHYFEWFPNRAGRSIQVEPGGIDAVAERVIYHDGNGLARGSMAR